MAVPRLPRCRKFELDRTKQIELTSSLQKHFICDLCNKKLSTKPDLILHLAGCAISRTCTWCNIVFKNRGSLFSHSLRIHGTKLSKTETIKPAELNHSFCPVCPKKYRQITNLKYHIRKDHFNLTAKVTEAEKRQINEVWWERVLNCDSLIEIKKTNLNMYLMRKVNMDKAYAVSESKEVMDLSSLYPTQVRSKRVWCDVCEKSYYLRDFAKHVSERHKHDRRHECNNCHKKFNRAYQYLQHNCKRKPRRDRENKVQLLENITLDD